MTNKDITMFGLSFDSLSMEKSLEIIIERITRGEFTQHAVINVAKLVNAQKDELLKESINACDITNVDGMGVVWGARLMGIDVPERVAGIDLFLRLIGLSEAKEFPVFLLGAREEIVKKAAEALMVRHPKLNIAGYHHGYFWDDEQKIVGQINKSGAKLLFVAITSPKKEYFINEWRGQLGIDFVMGVGGTFDVVAGKVSRAPVWVQNVSMEWLYRVLQEPKRMWKRYLITNSKFLWMLLRGFFSKAYRENG